GAVTAVALASRFWGLGCPKIFHEVATHLLVINLLILLRIFFALVKMRVPGMGVDVYVYGGVTFLCRSHEAWWKNHRRRLYVRNRALTI
ncbi:MAG: hypothetical protein AB2812_05200, partial [Candidatus Sedimenticola endophacoides]